MRKAVVTVVLGVVAYFLTVPILKGIYLLVSSLNSDFTFSNPIVGFAKYLVVPFFLILFIQRNWNLTRFGKVLLRGGLVIIGAIFLAISVTYNSTDEETIVQQRAWKRDVNLWSEVTHIQTEATVQNKREIFGITYRERTKSGSTIPHVVLEYRIFFRDGTSVNVWDDVSSLFRLHMFVKEQGIEVVHKEVKQEMADYMGYFIKGDEKKAREILGIQVQ